MVISAPGYQKYLETVQLGRSTSETIDLGQISLEQVVSREEAHSGSPMRTIEPLPELPDGITTLQFGGAQ